MPKGDILVAAGDICPYGSMEDVKWFARWIAKQPYKYKILIAGNHDKPFEKQNDLARALTASEAPGIHYLQDSPIKIEGILFYGSPWTPTFMDWHFMADRGVPIRAKWEKIPKGTDVLITHGPPATILDNVNGTPQGCSDLFERVMQVKPTYHIFGHIHEGYGRIQREGTTFVNASICSERYVPENAPVILEI